MPPFKKPVAGSVTIPISGPVTSTPNATPGNSDPSAPAPSAVQAATIPAAAPTALPTSTIPTSPTPEGSQPAINSQPAFQPAPDAQSQVTAPTTTTPTPIPPSLASPTSAVPASPIVPIAPSPVSTGANSQVCLTCTTPQAPNTGSITSTTLNNVVVAPQVSTPAPTSTTQAAAAPEAQQKQILNSVQCTTNLTVLGDGISLSQTTSQHRFGISRNITATIKLLDANKIAEALSTGKAQPLDLRQVLQVYASKNGKVDAAGLLPNILPIFTQATISALTAGQELLAGNLAGAGEKLIQPFCDAKLPTAQNALLTAIGVAGANKALGGGGISLSAPQAQILSAAINSNNNQATPQGNYFRAIWPSPVLQIKESQSNAPTHFGPKNNAAKVVKTSKSGFGVEFGVEAGSNIGGGFHASARATTVVPLNGSSVGYGVEFGVSHKSGARLSINPRDKSAFLGWSVSF